MVAGFFLRAMALSMGLLSFALFLACPFLLFCFGNVLDYVRREVRRKFGAHKKIAGVIANRVVFDAIPSIWRRIWVIRFRHWIYTMNQIIAVYGVVSASRTIFTTDIFIFFPPRDALSFWNTFMHVHSKCSATSIAVDVGDPDICDVCVMQRWCVWREKVTLKHLKQINGLY